MNRNVNVNFNIVGTLAHTLTFVLVLLKLFGLWEITWVQALSPALLYWGVVLAFVLVVIIAVSLFIPIQGYLKKRHKAKRTERNKRH